MKLCEIVGKYFAMIQGSYHVHPLYTYYSFPVLSGFPRSKERKYCMQSSTYNSLPVSCNVQLGRPKSSLKILKHLSVFVLTKNIFQIRKEYFINI
jgi:hypothetical protein